MIRFLSFITFVVGMSIGHADVRPQSGQPCGRSSECPFGESCVNYVCQWGGGAGACVGDYQCPVGERCVGGLCRVSLSSEASFSCEEILVSAAGIEFLTAGGGTQPLGCITSRDCTPSESCVNGKCVLNGGIGSCTSDVECPAGERCRAGKCGW